MDTEKFTKAIKLDREMQSLLTIKERIQNKDIRLTYGWNKRDNSGVDEIPRWELAPIQYMLRDANEYILKQIDYKIQHIVEEIENL